MTIPNSEPPFLNASDSPPSAAQWQAFWQLTLQAAGIISLSAGAIFFLAANWQHMSRWQRFGLFEAMFLICAVLAWTRPASHVLGALGLSGLTVLTGVLFGLFGQTFQTGADTYELFFAWAALSLPFACLSRQPGLWAFWAVVLNIALALFAQAPSGWRFFADSGYILNALMLGGINLMLAWAFLTLLRSQWLARFLQLIAAGYLTTGSLALVFASQSPPFTGVLYLTVCVAMLVLAWQSVPKDVFPITLIAINLIITSTAAIAEFSNMDYLVMFFALSFWVLASSGAAFAILLKLYRRWESDANKGSTRQ